MFDRFGVLLDIVYLDMSPTSDTSDALDMEWLGRLDLRFNKVRSVKEIQLIGVRIYTCLHITRHTTMYPNTAFNLLSCWIKKEIKYFQQISITQILFFCNFFFLNLSFFSKGTGAEDHYNKFSHYYFSSLSHYLNKKIHFFFSFLDL